MLNDWNVEKTKIQILPIQFCTQKHHRELQICTQFCAKYFLFSADISK